MFFEEAQKYLKNHYGISDEEITNIKSKLPSSKKYLYNEYLWTVSQSSLMPDFLKSWQDSYNLIRGENWPNCNSPNEFNLLPKEIQEECINIHKFSPTQWLDIDYNNFQPNQFDYSIHDLVRYQKIVLDNLDIISNKKIIDFAGHCGFLAFICLENNASEVITTNVRKNNIEIANKSANAFNLENKFNCIYSDIHDYQNNTKLTLDKDTVLLSGIMYHVHDHYEILESITQAGPKNIIIETAEITDITKSEKSLIFWNHEKDDSNFDGHFKGLDIIPVGFPNPSWFKLILESMGYVRTKIDYFDWFVRANFSEKNFNFETRSVQVFKKKWLTN